MICWKIRIFAYWTTPKYRRFVPVCQLWFAEKFVSLLIEQHPCGRHKFRKIVVICWKIRIFAYWTTPGRSSRRCIRPLWFAEKFVSLLIEQHLVIKEAWRKWRCDLLKNSYLCLLNNTWTLIRSWRREVVICWKIRIFAYWTTPLTAGTTRTSSCDLLKNSYLCLLNNTIDRWMMRERVVVICWKIRIFAYWTTPDDGLLVRPRQLWFAEKFVSLLIEQHLATSTG